jgi:hypothetical protein
MTMTLCGNLDAALLVCLCFIWVARLAVMVCPVWSCSMTILVHCIGSRPVPLQMNRSILFYFFNKIRQNCIFCSKKITVFSVDSTSDAYQLPSLYPKGAAH